MNATATPPRENASVFALEAHFEETAAALAAYDATKPEGLKYGTPEYEAWSAERSPLSTAQHAAERALSKTKALRVGTWVRFSTSAGWEGNDTSEGKIVKVTDASYVVEKGIRGTARLNRETAHENKGYSYSEVEGARSLRVVRTPAMQQAVEHAETEERRAQVLERELRNARQEEQSRVHRALLAQHGTLREAHNAAVSRLISKHKAEFDGLFMTALDLLGAQAPGREETTPRTPSTDA